MAKNDKPFQNASLALGRIWGSPVNAGHQGGRIHPSARRAGIKKGLPLTETEIEAQRVADELEAEEKAAQKAADPRSAYEKEYDIYDGIAHVTPEQFHELFLSQKFRQLRERVKTVYIDDNQGLSAVFTFNEPDIGEYRKVVPLRDIVKLGIAFSLAKANSLAKTNSIQIMSNDRYIGILRLQSMPTPLMHHARNMITKSKGPTMGNSTKRMTSPEEIAFLRGNFRSLFSRHTTLAGTLQSPSETGVEVTIDATRRRKDGAFKLGTLWRPESLDTTGLKIQRIELSKLYGLGKDISFPEENLVEPCKFLSSFFKKAAGFKITFNDRTIAILIRDGIHPPPVL